MKTWKVGSHLESTAACRRQLTSMCLMKSSGLSGTKWKMLHSRVMLISSKMFSIRDRSTSVALSDNCFTSFNSLTLFAMSEWEKWFYLYLSDLFTAFCMMWKVNRKSRSFFNRSVICIAPMPEGLHERNPLHPNPHPKVILFQIYFFVLIIAIIKSFHVQTYS